MIEILFVPGMVLGFISVVLIIVGIIFSFKDYGATTGFIVLTATIVVTALAIYLAFKSNLWRKIGVETSIEGKANVLKEGTIKVGDTGKTISRLNPIGKALINNLHVEVHSQDNFIDQEKEIVVVKVQNNKIFVKQKAE
jgi:membrane-bound ClpP family serine protease